MNRRHFLSKIPLLAAITVVPAVLKPEAVNAIEGEIPPGTTFSGPVTINYPGDGPLNIISNSFRSAVDQKVPMLNVNLNQKAAP